MPNGNAPFTQGLRPSCDRVASEKWPLLAVTRNDSYWGRNEVSMVVGTISPFRTAQNTRKVCAIDELKKLVSKSLVISSHRSHSDRI